MSENETTLIPVVEPSNRFARMFAGPNGAVFAAAIAFGLGIGLMLLGSLLGALPTPGGSGSDAVAAPAVTETVTVTSPGETATETAEPETGTVTRSAPDEATPDAATDQTSLSTTSPTATKSSKTLAPGQEPAIRRTEAGVALPRESSIDLDSDAANWGIPEGGPIGDMQYILGSLRGTGTADLAFIILDAEPSYGDCSDSTLYQAVLPLPQENKWVCITRDDRPFVKFRVAGFLSSPSSILMDITVWEGA